VKRYLPRIGKIARDYLDRRRRRARRERGCFRSPRRCRRGGDRSGAPAAIAVKDFELGLCASCGVRPHRDRGRAGPRPPHRLPRPRRRPARLHGDRSRLRRERICALAIRGRARGASRGPCPRRKSADASSRNRRRCCRQPRRLGARTWSRSCRAPHCVRPHWPAGISRCSTKMAKVPEARPGHIAPPFGRKVVAPRGPRKLPSARSQGKLGARALYNYSTTVYCIEYILDRRLAGQGDPP
jgi:hypothetical protein